MLFGGGRLLPFADSFHGTGRHFLAALRCSGLCLPARPPRLHLHQPGHRHQLRRDRGAGSCQRGPSPAFPAAHGGPERTPGAAVGPAALSASLPAAASTSSSRRMPARHRSGRPPGPIPTAPAVRDAATRARQTGTGPEAGAHAVPGQPQDSRCRPAAAGTAAGTACQEHRAASSRTCLTAARATGSAFPPPSRRQAQPAPQGQQPAGPAPEHAPRAGAHQQPGSPEQPDPEQPRPDEVRSPRGHSAYARVKAASCSVPSASSLPEHTETARLELQTGSFCHLDGREG